MTSTNTTADYLQRTRHVQQVATPRLELVQLKGFLDVSLCGQLIELIDANRRPSTLADANGDVTFRTSETCDLDPYEPAIMELEHRLLALNGIDPAYGEPAQGQRYAEGQEFKPHCDWFNPGGADYERYCSIAGQRTWTFMIYLNDVEAGGATRFRTIEKTIRPETGKLVGWNNMRLDGSPNPDTLHHGMKVRRGTKYIVTKWYRERMWK